MPELRLSTGVGGTLVDRGDANSLYEINKGLIVDIAALRVALAAAVVDIAALNASHSLAKDDLEAIKGTADHTAITNLTLTVTDVTLTGSAPAALTTTTQS